MTKVYPAIFHDDEDGYWVEFPDLEGCNTCGDGLEDTMKMAQEALGLYLVALLEDGKELPTASDINSITTDGGFASYVSVDVNQYRRDTRAVKKTLSIPAWLAKEAEANGVSLSRVLQDALMLKLGVTG